MKKTLNVLFITLVLLLLLALPAGTLLVHEGGYNIFENRILADMPADAMSIRAVLDGEFFPALETWYKDHVVWRDNMLRYNTRYQILLGKPSVNGILTSEGHLLPVVDPKYTESVPAGDIAAAVNEVAALKAAADTYGGQVIYMGVPGQITMFADSYPDCLSDTPAYFRETGRLFADGLAQAGITFVDGWDYLTPDMYFQVDHHFGVTGGCAVYRRLCAETGVEPVSAEHFTFYRLPNPFYGSRNRPIYDITSVRDQLEVFDMDFTLPFERFDNGNPVPAGVIPFPADDQTIVSENYMGGDIAETVIQTHRPELPNLLIYGDSYTNAVECFAYLSFNETRSLDLRLYSAMSLCDYVKLYQPDYIVCVRDDGNYATLTGNGKLTG